MRDCLRCKGRVCVRWFIPFTLAGLICFLLLDGCFSKRLPNNVELTVVHLADPHLSTYGQVTDTPWTHKIAIGGYKLHKKCTGKSFDLLEKAVAVINAKIKPDVVVVTGDIIDTGDDIAALKKGAEIIRRLNCPVIISKGDHDIARKSENMNGWESAFGKLDGFSEVNEFAFFYIPFESDTETFKSLEDGIKAAQGKKQPGFLCMHRMLYSSWLMDVLCKRWHRTELLSPDRDTIIDLLKKPANRWIVLCGHSHTNHEKTHGNITEFCTSSLAEYPHELRILKVKSGDVWTTVVRIDEVPDECERFLSH